jgi:hypothetical protein
VFHCSLWSVRRVRRARSRVHTHRRTRYARTSTRSTVDSRLGRLRWTWVLRVHGGATRRIASAPSAHRERSALCTRERRRCTVLVVGGIHLNFQISMPKRQFDRLEQLTQHVAATTLEPTAAAAAPKHFDLVLAGGRVIDPESGTHSVDHARAAASRVLLASGLPQVPTRCSMLA